LCAGGIAQHTLYSDISLLPPATVLRLTNGSQESSVYFQWRDHLGQRSIGVTEAKRRFIEIGCQYLSALVCRNAEISCSLSGGTDSALVGGLLNQLMANPPRCFTVDYRLKRYSEFDSAKMSAARLHLPLTRVLASGSDFREAFQKLNSSILDRPCSHSQAALFLHLAIAARKDGIKTIVT